MHKILIIDDDSTLLMVMERAMLRRGFEVAVAQNAQQALSQCKDFQPTHISLDLKLENETGLQLIPQLKQLCPSACIVMLTAYASIATAVDAVKLGAHQYLCKPVDADQLLAAFETSTLPETEQATSQVQDKPTSVKRLEWEKIQHTLQINAGNISATARDLGMHRRTLQRKLLKHPVKH